MKFVFVDYSESFLLVDFLAFSKVFDFLASDCSSSRLDFSFRTSTQRPEVILRTAFSYVTYIHLTLAICENHCRIGQSVDETTKFMSPCGVGGLEIPFSVSPCRGAVGARRRGRTANPV